MKPAYLSRFGLFLRGWCVITGSVAGNVLSGLQGYQADWTPLNWSLLLLGAYVTFTGATRAWLDQSISDAAKGALGGEDLGLRSRQEREDGNHATP